MAQLSWNSKSWTANWFLSSFPWRLHIFLPDFPRWRCSRQCRYDYFQNSTMVVRQEVWRIVSRNSNAQSARARSRLRLRGEPDKSDSPSLHHQSTGVLLNFGIHEQSVLGDQELQSSSQIRRISFPPAVFDFFLLRQRMQFLLASPRADACKKSVVSWNVKMPLYRTIETSTENRPCDMMIVNHDRQPHLQFLLDRSSDWHLQRDIMQAICRSIVVLPCRSRLFR